MKSATVDPEISLISIDGTPVDGTVEATKHGATPDKVPPEPSCDNEVKDNSEHATICRAEPKCDTANVDEKEKGARVSSNPGYIAGYVTEKRSGHKTLYGSVAVAGTATTLRVVHKRLPRDENHIDTTVLSNKKHLPFASIDPLVSESLLVVTVDKKWLGDKTKSTTFEVSGNRATKSALILESEKTTGEGSRQRTQGRNCVVPVAKLW